MFQLRPNILLLTIDCLRADYLGGLGGKPALTPNLDRLAGEGVKFEQAITGGGWTRVAMTALFSGTHGLMFDNPMLGYGPDRPSLPELLQAQGYLTAGFNTNPVCGREAGFARGFDSFEDLAGETGKRLSHRLPPPKPSVLAQPLVDRVMAWLLPGEPRNQPVFTWAHFMDLHWPYAQSRRGLPDGELREAWKDRAAMRRVSRAHGRGTPAAERLQRWADLYREELESVDEQIGRLTGALRDAGELDDTLLVITGDHGEEFFEHGTWGHAFQQLHDEGIRVPLIMHGQGFQAQTVAQQVSAIDVAPTVLDLAGAPAHPEMLGVSLAPLMRGAYSSHLYAERSPEAYVELFGHQGSACYRLAIRTEDYKYVFDMESPDVPRLYDLRADPSETRDVYAHRPEAARHFDLLRRGHMAFTALGRREAQALATPEPADPILIARLEALGYIE